MRKYDFEKGALTLWTGDIDSHDCEGELGSKEELSGGDEWCSQRMKQGGAYTKYAQ